MVSKFIPQLAVKKYFSKGDTVKKKIKGVKVSYLRTFSV